MHTATAAATSDKLGELLVRDGLITLDQLKRALLEQKNTGMRLGYTLVKLGFVEETEISKMLARQYRMPAVDLSRFEVDPKILKLIPPDIAVKHTVLPLKREGRTLTVAIADPNNVTAIEDLKFVTRCDVFPVIAGEYTLRNAIERYYQQSDAELQSLLKSVAAAEELLEVVEDHSNGGDEAAGEDAGGPHLARQDHGAIEHRRAARAAGRAHQAEDGEQGHRLPGLDPPRPVWRKDRAPHPRQGQPHARPDEVRLRAEGRAGPDAGDPESLRDGARDGPHRVGQDDHALFGAVPHQPDRRKHPDGRGPGRVQPAGHQPGAGSERGGDDVRGGVRRICKDCKQEQKYNDEELKALGIPAAEAAKLTFYRGAGCDNCGGTGYKGRQGLYEVMAMSSALRRMVLKGGSTEELREEAVKEGMLTLRSDGMVKVKRGITTLEEVVKETAA